jgi:hypothetical protein
MANVCLRVGGFVPWNGVKCILTGREYQGDSGIIVEGSEGVEARDGI